MLYDIRTGGIVLIRTAFYRGGVQIEGFQAFFMGKPGGHCQKELLFAEKMAFIYGVLERIVVNDQIKTAGKELLFHIVGGGFCHFYIYGWILSHKTGEQRQQNIGGKQITSANREVSGTELSLIHI